MKVLFVYQFLTLGGVESVLRTRLEGLPACGAEAHAWFLADSGAFATFDECHDRVHIGGLGSLQRLVTDFSPHVIASIDTEDVFRLPFDGKHAPVLVAECHSPYEENLGYLSRLSRHTVRAVLVPSEHQRATVERKLRGRIPIRVVPNPVGPSFLRQAISTRETLSQPILAWVGRLDSLKNWEAFLEIGALVNRDEPPVQVWVIGDTRETPVARRLYKVAKEKGVLSRLRWLRDVPHAEMPSLFGAVRDSGGLVVSTSRNESFGMAVAEAMACSNAVLAPQQGPFPELITDGETGCLYDPANLRAAAAIARGILNDTTLRSRLGEAAHRVVVARYASDVALNLLVDALRSAALTSGHE